MSAKHQGVFELADDIPLTLADDPDIDLGDLLTVPRVERQARSLKCDGGWDGCRETIEAAGYIDAKGYAWSAAQHASGTRRAASCDHTS